jgi:hypothetical protein
MSHGGRSTPRVRATCRGLRVVRTRRAPARAPRTSTRKAARKARRLGGRELSGGLLLLIELTFDGSNRMEYKSMKTWAERAVAIAPVRSSHMSETRIYQAFLPVAPPPPGHHPSWNYRRRRACSNLRSCRYVFAEKSEGSSRLDPIPTCHEDRFPATPSALKIPAKARFLSGRPDLNRGPHRPERCALPGCATPRSIQYPTGTPA